MKFKIKTVDFLSALKKSGKCAGNKFDPIGNYIALSVVDNILTTTITNRITALNTITKVDGDNFYACLPYDKLNKLVSKISSEYISFSLVGTNVKIKADGTYTLAALVNSVGEIAEIKDFYRETMKADYTTTISYNQIADIISMGKGSLHKGKEYTCCYENYYIDDTCAMTTDSIVATYFSICDIFPTPILLSPTLVDIFKDMEGAISIEYNDKQLKAYNDDTQVISQLPNGLKDYRVSVIKDLTQKEYEGTIQVYRDALLSAAERLSIFVNEVADKFTIRLEFDENKITLSTLSGDTETINGDGANCNGTCNVNINCFVDALKSMKGDVIDVSFGKLMPIRLFNREAVYKIIAPKA
jgi:DNA polymerase III sliding clamp (beta) subunit (PCNA family)